MQSPGGEKGLQRRENDLNKAWQCLLHLDTLRSPEQLRPQAHNWGVAGKGTGMVGWPSVSDRHPCWLKAMGRSSRVTPRNLLELTTIELGEQSWAQ